MTEPAQQYQRVECPTCRRFFFEVASPPGEPMPDACTRIRIKCRDCSRREKREVLVELIFPLALESGGFVDCS